MTAAADQQWVTVRSARIRVRVDGDLADPSRPTVVLLHGIGRSLEDWSEQQQRLAGEMAIVSLDLPGFGLSEPLPGPASLRDLAGSVLEVLDELGRAGPVHLAGNSLGGAVALQLLALHPERVASLTLVSSAGFGTEVALALRLIAVPVLGRRLLSRTSRDAVARVERSLFVDAALVTEDRLEHAMLLARQPHRAKVFADVSRHLGTHRGIRAAWREELLGAVAEHPVPTLVVWGEKDLVLPAHHLQAAREHLPHATFHEFPRTGHMAQIERAEEFTDLLRELIRTAASEPAR